jgi:predicted unusual protein kinase regulating ubiquinone biosynthesis (AarF/ABC1/UbiB family)
VKEMVNFTINYSGPQDFKIPKIFEELVENNIIRVKNLK